MISYVPNKYKSKDLTVSSKKLTEDSILANLSDSTLESINDSVCNVSEIEPYAQ